MRTLPTLLAASLLATAAAAQNLPATSVQPLTEIAIHPERDASAQVVSLNESRIAAEIAGRIEEVTVEVGQVGELAAPGTPLASGRIVWRDPDPHIPPELVVRRAGRPGVFVVDAGVARFHPLPEAQEGSPARADLPPWRARRRQGTARPE